MSIRLELQVEICTWVGPFMDLKVKVVFKTGSYMCIKPKVNNEVLKQDKENKY